MSQRQAASQAKNDTNLAKQSGVSKNTQHNVKLLPWKRNRNLRRSSLEDQAEALTEIQVAEKQAAEIKNKVQTVKNSLEVTNSCIKLTPRLKPNIRGGM